MPEFANVCHRTLGLLFSVMIASNAIADEITRQNVYSWENSVGYSQIVEANGFVFLSGVASTAGTFEQQVEDVYSQINDMLQDMGLTMDSIVRETVFTTDIDRFKSALAQRRQFFSEGAFPSATWVQVERLYFPNYLVEVEVMAVRP